MALHSTAITGFMSDHSHILKKTCYMLRAESENSKVSSQMLVLRIEV